MKKVKTIVIVLETILIFVLLFIIMVIDYDNKFWEDSQCCPYGINDYDYLEVDNYSKLKFDSADYDIVSNYLWKQTDIIIKSFYENGMAYADVELNYDAVKEWLNLRNSEDFQNKILDDCTVIANASVVDVMHFEDKAIVSYVYDISVINSQNMRIYHDNAVYQGPNKLYLRCENGVWYIDKMRVAV